MPKSRPPYPAEFRQQIVELARTTSLLELDTSAFDPERPLAVPISTVESGL